MKIHLLFEGVQPLCAEDVLQKIDQYNINDNYVRDALIDSDKVARIMGFSYQKQGAGFQMIAWQCNFASLKKNEMRLPTILTISIDEAGNLAQIDLHASFKGSQGIPCSQKYLNRRLQLLVGEAFSDQNPRLADPLFLCCRHVFELAYGAACFFSGGRALGKEQSHIAETTIGYQSDGTIELYDRTVFDTQESNLRLDVTNYTGNLAYNADGAVKSCKGACFEAFRGENGGFVPMEYTKTLDVDNKDDYRVRLMKIVSKIWIASKKALGVKRSFYYTNLWPTSLFGVVSQLFSISVFSDNYAYFQYSIAGIQRDEDRCFCIGVIKDVAEGMRTFADFRAEDLY